MGTSSLAWLPWTVLLSGVGLFATWLAYRKGDRAAVVRRLGWSLLPWGLWCMGLIKFAVRVTDAVADWAAGFVFSPLSWLGVGLSVLAVAMIGGGAFLSGRRRGARSSGGSGGSEAAAAPKQVKSKPSAKPAAGVEDEEDIEAILRRHGIE